jgi:hypothetical protein
MKPQFKLIFSLLRAWGSAPIRQPLCVLRQAQREENFYAISGSANKNFLNLSPSKAEQSWCSVTV